MTLESHGRYTYRSILDRPDYDWPGGKRLAVYVALNIEAFRFGRGKGAAIAPPDSGAQPQHLLLARLREPGSASGDCWSCSTISGSRPKPR